jgi:hypothetical protein
VPLQESSTSIPASAEESEDSLPEIWVSWIDIGLDMKEIEAERWAKSLESFLRPNAIFANRNLISL